LHPGKKVVAALVVMALVLQSLTASAAFAEDQIGGYVAFAFAVAPWAMSLLAYNLGKDRERTGGAAR